jgi:hypothetical protein
MYSRLTPYDRQPFSPLIGSVVHFEKKKFLVGEFAIEISGTNFEFGVGPPDK